VDGLLRKTFNLEEKEPSPEQKDGIVPFGGPCEWTFGCRGH